MAHQPHRANRISTVAPLDRVDTRGRATRESDRDRARSYRSCTSKIPSGELAVKQEAVIRIRPRICSTHRTPSCKSMVPRLVPWPVRRAGFTGWSCEGTLRARTASTRSTARPAVLSSTLNTTITERSPPTASTILRTCSLAAAMGAAQASLASSLPIRSSCKITSATTQCTF